MTARRVLTEDGVRILLRPSHAISEGPLAAADINEVVRVPFSAHDLACYHGESAEPAGSDRLSFVLKAIRVAAFVRDDALAQELVCNALHAASHDAAAVRRVCEHSPWPAIASALNSRSFSPADFTDGLQTLVEASGGDQSGADISLVPIMLEGVPAGALPQGIAMQLARVRVSCRPLTHLPASIGEMSSLQYLNLSRCLELTTLPERIGDCQQLQTLSLDRCALLTSLPERIGDCKQLQTLTLAMCHSFAALPARIGDCQQLQTLNLHRCEVLTALPERIGDCRQLQTLTFYQCTSLIALPERIGDCQQLQTLRAHSCGALTALPERIGNCEQLQTLIFEQCTSLTALPERIGGCQQLQTLSLAYDSSLTALPERIGDCQQLQTLTLHCCASLTALSESIGDCQQLHTLRASKCRSLTALPKRIVECQQLHTLDLPQQLEEMAGGGDVQSRIVRCLVRPCSLLRSVRTRALPANITTFDTRALMGLAAGLITENTLSHSHAGCSARTAAAAAAVATAAKLGNRGAYCGAPGLDSERNGCHADESPQSLPAAFVMRRSMRVTVEQSSSQSVVASCRRALVTPEVLSSTGQSTPAPDPQTLDFV